MREGRQHIFLICKDIILETMLACQYSLKKPYFRLIFSLKAIMILCQQQDHDIRFIKKFAAHAMYLLPFQSTADCVHVFCANGCNVR